MPRRTTSTPATEADEASGDAGAARASINEVTLVGRVAAPPEERTLPSGDSLMIARIIVDRDAASRGRSQQRVDTIDCVAWLAKVQRSMRTWTAGEYVEVAGAIRRRFFRGTSGPVSRVEVEIRRTRRVRASDG